MDAFKYIGLKFLAIFMATFFLLSSPDRVCSQDPAIDKEKKTFTIHGHISLNLIGYHINGIPERADPFTSILSGNATASFKKLEVPLSFVISNKKTGSSNSPQSFNQFGLSPRWKWITLHGGYRNITFSSYTLVGHTFLGAGIELNPGLFRFGMMYGRFNRKTSGSNLSWSDPLPYFARKGFAAKIGLGNESNFFDLVFLRIRDDSTTLQQADTGMIRTPAQNVVAGINSRFTFFKKLTWDTEGAFSLYTTNLGAQSISEIEEDKTLGKVNKFLVINFSSEYYYAVRSALRYKEKNWSLKLEYRRIEPRYRSMGAYFFNNDVSNLTFSPSFYLFKRKLSLTGSIGMQQDNLRNTKKATSKRTIGNLNISYNPKPVFGISANYSHYNINQKDGRLPLNDTLRVRQATHNFSLMPRLFFIKPTKSHMVMFVYNLTACRDKNEFTADYTHFTNHIVQLNYILGLLESRWSVTTGLTFTRANYFMLENKGTGGNAGVSKTLLKDNKLSVSWNNSLIRSVATNSSGWVYNTNLSSSYQVGKHNSLRLYIYFTGNYSDAGSINPSFNELKGEMSYAFKF